MTIMLIIIAWPGWERSQGATRSWHRRVLEPPKEQPGSLIPKVQPNNIKARHRIFNANVATSLKSAPLHPPTCLSRSTPRAFILLPGENIIQHKNSQRMKCFAYFTTASDPGQFGSQDASNPPYIFLTIEKSKHIQKHNLLFPKKIFNHNKLPALRELVNGYTKQ